MLYQIFFYPTKIISLFYFKRIFYSNAHLIPKGKALLFAANHPNTFIDSMLLCYFRSKPINSITRGDVFGNKLVAKILRSVNLLPIYREREGKELMHRNDKTFQDCVEIFKKKGEVIIFAEGLCIQEKRLRPLKKGTARLAFLALEQNVDVTIVPLGINYTYGNRFRLETMLDFGLPLSPRDYSQLYQENPAKAINKFTIDLEKELAKHVVTIHKKENENILELMLKIARNDNLSPVFPNFFTTRGRFEMEYAIAHEINQLDEHKPSVLDNYKLEFNTYFEQLKKNNITDRSLFTSTIQVLTQVLLLIIGLPLAKAGMLINAVPWFATNAITKKIIKSIEFVTSVKITVMLFIYLILLLVTCGVGLALWGLQALLMLLLFPLLSYTAIHWLNLGKRFISNCKALVLLNRKPDIFNGLKTRRTQLSGIIKQMS